MNSPTNYNSHQITEHKNEFQLTHTPIKNQLTNFDVNRSFTMMTKVYWISIKFLSLSLFTHQALVCVSFQIGPFFNPSSGSQRNVTQKNIIKKNIIIDTMCGWRRKTKNIFNDEAFLFSLAKKFLLDDFVSSKMCSKRIKFQFHLECLLILGTNEQSVSDIEE